MQGSDSEKDRAKQIIIEIITQAGGEFHNKTNMYKAFWKAHLEYAAKNPGYLSMWPIVRMPNGPGIHEFDRLIGELVAEGSLELDQITNHGFEAFRFKLTEPQTLSSLSSAEVEAVRKGVAFVRGRTAKSVSDDSHELSRSWNEAERDGAELNIYLDLMSEEEYRAKKEKMRRFAQALEE